MLISHHTHTHTGLLLASWAAGQVIYWRSWHFSSNFTIGCRLEGRPAGVGEGKFEVTAEGAITAARCQEHKITTSFWPNPRRLVSEQAGSKVTLLNFASAKNPCGGMARGALAQVISRTRWQMVRIFAGGKHRSLLRPVCFSATVLGHLLFEAQAGAQVNTKIISGVKLISVFIWPRYVGTMQVLYGGKLCI